MFSRYALSLLLFLSLNIPINAQDSKQKEGFVPIPGQFAPLDKAKYYSGEIIQIDHINRRAAR